MKGRGLGKSALQDARGSLAVQFAVALPVLLAIVATAIDFSQSVSQRLHLQAVVDKAAVDAARELGLSDAKLENVSAAVEAVVLASFNANKDGRLPAPTTQTHVRQDPLEVDVVAYQRTQPYFGAGLGLTAAQIEVRAVARIVGRPNICLLALDASANGALSLEKNAKVTGNDCAVYSNSSHTNAIKSKNSAVLSANLICSAGGKDGSSGNFTPQPITDCPAFEDPLSGRPAPTIGPCDNSVPKIVEASGRLYPGTYCGGLEIAKGAVVELEAGIYIIKDGPLKVGGGGRLTGAGVGFYLTGSGATLQFAQDSGIDLTAPEGGAMAGLLAFEDRNQSASGVHQILSDDARNLLGTIYLSRTRIHVDAGSPIADRSAYTAIVARMVTLSGGPHLILNANYSQTNVPVPEGIRGVAQPVSLVR